MFKQYYGTLYTSKMSTEMDQKGRDLFFSKLGLPRLLQEHVEGLEAPIAETEIRKAILMMKAGKSPGYDGIPAEYYRTYIDILVPVLQKVYQETFERGQFPPTFNEAFILLIPKKIKTVQIHQLIGPSVCLTWIVKY